jgi:hypothetical protein
LHPWFLALGWVLLVAWIAHSASSRASLLIATLLVTLVLIMAARLTIFCDACGAMSINWPWFTGTRPCSRCSRHVQLSMKRDGPV